MLTGEAPLCMWCDQPATRWCDAALAMVSAGVRKPKNRPAYEVTSIDAMLSGSYKCDAPFCAKHGRVVGFVCGEDPDTIDHCHYHAQHHEAVRVPILMLEDIEVLRTDLHARIRREQFSVVLP